MSRFKDTEEPYQPITIFETHMNPDYSKTV